MKPSTIMLLAGGVVLFISTFLPWVSIGDFDENALDTTFLGFQGFWLLLIGAGVAVLTGLTAFGNVNLPDRVVGFTWNQLFLMFGLAAFLIAFGRQFGDNTGFGVLLGWIGAALIVVGAFMEMQSEGRGSGASGMPPTTF